MPISIMLSGEESENYLETLGIISFLKRLNDKEKSSPKDDTTVSSLVDRILGMLNTEQLARTLAEIEHTMGQSDLSGKAFHTLADKFGYEEKEK